MTSTLTLLLFLSPSARALGILGGDGPWPESSERAVTALEHPTLAQRLSTIGGVPGEGIRFVAFGDQRALADGEWQAIIQGIVDVEAERSDPLPLLFVLDTGDIVDDGSHSDQFHVLTRILEPLRGYPYLVGVGNHEVDNNRPGPARRNTVAFLQSTGPELSEERLYYRRDVGGLRLIFLDTNDLVYGPAGDEEELWILSDRGREQLVWLREQLSEPESGRTTIVVTHHPFLSSSKMHSQQGSKLWSLELDGVSLPQMLASGGVDLVLAGHTHTYERFHVTAPGGGSFHLVNLSGRPRDSFLWFGAGRRKAREIHGREEEHLRERGWKDLDGWQIQQRDAMVEEEENQWAQIRLSPDGALTIELFYLRDRGEDGVRTVEPVLLD